MTRKILSPLAKKKIDHPYQPGSVVGGAGTGPFRFMFAIPPGEERFRLDGDAWATKDFTLQWNSFSTQAGTAVVRLVITDEFGDRIFLADGVRAAVVEVEGMLDRLHGIAGNERCYRRWWLPTWKVRPHRWERTGADARRDASAPRGPRRPWPTLLPSGRPEPDAA